MSYLLTHLPRPAGSPSPGARIDLDRLLNRPGYHADAHVRVYVEDTSGRKLRLWRSLPEPRIEFEITDCINAIRLEFDVSSVGSRENSLYKLDTLLDAIAAFRTAVQAEAELHAQREDERARRLAKRRRPAPLLTKGGDRCRI